MARLIISLDSEDYETPASDDAELWWAGALTRHGIRGSFCLVGELVRALRARGRRDVLQAYAPHEISYHSNLHSAHPTHAEYLEELDWDAGVARVLREEHPGIQAVREATGRQPAAYCKPGNSWGPQVADAMPRLGVPVFCDAPLEWSPGRPMWCAGSLFLRYHLSLDRFFGEPQGRLERMQQAVAQLLEAHGDGYAVIYTHPCRLYTAAFPDNFTSGKNPPRAEWRPAPLRPAAEREALQGDLDALLRWIARDLRPEIVGYGEVWEAHAPGPAEWLNREQVRKLARLIPAAPAPVEWEGGWLSAAEQWSGVVGAAALGEVHLTWPKQVAVSRLLGPVEQPAETSEPFRVPIGALMLAARRALESAIRTGRIPAAIDLNGATIGPNALLLACAQAIPQHFRARWPEHAAVTPADEVPALARREDFASLRYQNSWSIFPPEFRGEKLLALARLQAWTAKPAIPKG